MSLDRSMVSTARVGRRRRLLKWAAVPLIALAFAVTMRAFVAQPFYVPSQSMFPTLQAGDRILVVKASALAGSVARGDIVVFQRPGASRCKSDGDGDGDLVKRVIGMPGDTIWSVGEDKVYLNGMVLDEPGWYRSGMPQVGSTPIRKTTIPAGSYFVLGDNRTDSCTDSCDSRTFGVIPDSLIVGEVMAVVWRDGRLYVHFF
jgi:signal peptidase I